MNITIVTLGAEIYPLYEVFGLAENQESEPLCYALRREELTIGMHESFSTIEQEAQIQVPGSRTQL